MRLNKYIAHNTGLSRRRADELIQSGKVLVNGQPAKIGQQLAPEDSVSVNSKVISPSQHLYLMLNKPIGYVCSKRSQGSDTVYSLLPDKYANLKTVGRLDKDSSGLILLSNDGNFAHRLTHPAFKKDKSYLIKLNRQLKPVDKLSVEQGVELADGPSRLKLTKAGSSHWKVTMHEGRNRQIRRTFEALGYTVEELHRTKFGQYELKGLLPGQFKEIDLPRA